MLVVISHPINFSREHLITNELFKLRLQTYHLRKPECNKKDFEDVLKSIPPENKKKVVLHQHHELAAKYNVKGLHLKEERRKKLSIQDLKDLKKEMKIKNLTLSSSFHSTEEMIKHDGLFDYVFLSPVFESISKPGYVSENQFLVNGLMNKTKVIALGGISSDNISKAKDLGFDGVAIMGALWKNPDQALSEFEAIRQQYSCHFH